MADLPPPSFPPPATPEWSDSAEASAPLLTAPPTPLAPPAPVVRPPSTRGLSTAMNALYWVVALSSGLVGLAMYSRSSRWDRFVAGDKNVDMLIQADDRVALAAIVQLGVVLAAAIVTAIWCHRVASYVKARFTSDIRPGMAAGGWFIPVGNIWLGFNEMKKAARDLSLTDRAVSNWQSAIVGNVILTVLTRGLARGSDASGAAGRFQMQWIIALGSMLLLAIGAVVARKATRELDDAVAQG